MRILKMLDIRVVVFVVLAFVVPARADHGGECREDAKRFCPKESGPARFHCLESHKNSLSVACQESLGHMRAEGEQFRRDCHDDAAKLCPGREGRKLMECFEENADRISPACAEHVRKIKSERRVMKERIPAACKVDVEKLCLQTGPSQNGILACLKADPAKLGEPCRKALAQPETSK